MIGDFIAVPPQHRRKMHAAYLNPAPINRRLLAIAAFFWLAHLVVICVPFISDENYKNVPLMRLFHLNEEGNLPSFFAALLLLIAAGLLFLIGRLLHQVGQGKQWFFLGFVFLFLCVDEAVQIHELLAVVTTGMRSGARGFSWTIPYLLASLAIFAYLYRWLLKLPATTRKQFLVAGSIYIGGALVLEMVEGQLNTAFGDTSSQLFILACVTLQEVLEMLGVLLFIRALLEYLSVLIGRSAITITVQPRK